MPKPKFVITPYKIYRRGDIFVKCGFDLDGSEGSINQNFMQLRQFTSIIDETKPTRPTYVSHPAEMRKTTLDDGSSYWSLVTDGGWFEYRLREEYNPHLLFEVMYDYANPGVGQLDLWVNGILTEVQKGPSTWSTSAPHKAVDEVIIRGRQRNFGLSDPPGRAELDNLCIYPYNEIDCEMFQYAPPKATSAPIAVETIRGHANYQTTKYLGTQIECSLRFFSANDHTDFITHADSIHVVCDDKGVFYRGVVELLDCTRIGRDLYQQDVIFRSPNKLGEGWK